MDVDADSNDALDIGYGGTGSQLTDPGADRIMFWDDSAAAGSNVTWLAPGTGLSITATTINVTWPVTFTSAYSDDFDAALVAIGATATTLFVDAPCTMSTNVSVPATCTVVLMNGGSIDQAGNTLTFLSSPIFWGGTITNDAALTFGVCFICPTYKALSATTGVVYTTPQTIFPEFYGALGDNSANDSVAIQAAIDDIETAKGGTVQFLSKIYVCNIEAKSYVELKGMVPMFKGSTTATTSHSNTYLKANATGHIITTAAGALHGITVRNIGFIGLGSGTALKGIYLQNVSRSIFEDLAFDNFADEAIRINDGNPNHFSRIFAQNCLLDTSQAAKIGVLHIEVGADDQWVSDCEFTASTSSLSDANAYICAVVIDASNCMFRNVIAEISDIGFHLTANGFRNHFIGCRSELNYSHGYEILGYRNQFVGCYSLSNGHETDDTYDGFHSTSAAYGNIFSGCLADCFSTDTEKHRYGFYDGYSGANQRSTYSGCDSKEHQTATYYNNPVYGAGPSIADQGLFLFTADDATPSVDNRTFFSFNSYTGATNVTNFDNGAQGQTIQLLDPTANGYITLVDNATIYTNTGANKVLASGKIYTFRLYGTIWREVE